MSKSEFFAEVAHLLDEVPLTEVLKSRGIQVIDEHHLNAKALCPFHGDRNFGSFLVSNRKKIYKCFSCGEGGGSVHKLVYSLDKGHRTFEQSVMHTAIEFGIITPDQYEWYFKRKVSEDAVQEVKRFYCERMPESSISRADAVVLDQVYRIFKEGWKLQHPKEATATVSPEHYAYLTQERHLTPQQILEGEYFTMPNRRAFNTFVRRLMEAGVIPYQKYLKDADLSILHGVPGFYQYRDSGRWTFKAVAGLGLPLHNAEGLIVGIQIRQDKVKTGQNRYRWFTSSFADEYNEEFMNGVSAGTPIDVIYPSTDSKPGVAFITEGLFKSQMLASQFKSIALSVQGVSTWRNIGAELRALMQKGYPLSYLYIAFDADMAHNPQVFKQALRMTDAIHREFPHLNLVYVCWDVSMGKGIDDMILNGYKDRLAKLPKGQFDLLYHQFTSYMVQLHNIQSVEDWRAIPLEELTHYFNQIVLCHFKGYEHLAPSVA